VKVWTVEFTAVSRDVAMSWSEEVAVRRERVVPVVLVGAVPLAALVALTIGRSAVLAATGAALVIVYWLLQTWFERIGTRGSIARMTAAAIGGVAVRYLFIVVALVAIAVVDRAHFLAAAASFLSVFTLYYVVKFALNVR
jgi:hypothetical protein